MIPLTRPVEFDKLSAKVRKRYPTPAALAPSRIALKKYDGVCGIGVFVPGQRPRMVSRTGEDYSVSCGLLLEALELGLRRLGHGSAVVYTFGEVWRPGCPQPTISGDFRQQRATITDFQYMLFDLVVEGLHDPYRRRRVEYVALSHVCPTGIVYPAQEVLTGDPVETARLQGPGFDGIVLWDPMGFPLDDRKATGGEAIKFKPTITVDVRCNGGVQGEGKHAGRLGALTFSYQGRAGTVGTGFSDKQREELWHALVHGTQDPPSGYIMELEAMGYTPDGSLREPRFKGFRYDKDKADDE